MYRDIDHELSEQTSALESLLNELDDEMAMEGLFSKPKSVDQMLAKVKKNISKKCKTVEDCDDMLANLKNEEEKFNSALSTMKDAAVQFKNGEIDKKELKNIIKPAAKDLKKTCNIISLKDINEDTTNVTDEEIQKLHDFLVGTRDAINERKNELSGEGTAEEGCGSKLSCESFCESFVGGYLDDDLSSYDSVTEASIALESAIESLRSWIIKFCDNMRRKCETAAAKAYKDNDKHDGGAISKAYTRLANIFKEISEKCVNANTEAELKRQRDKAKENAEVLSEIAKKDREKQKDVEVLSKQAKKDAKKDDDTMNMVKKGASRQAMGNSGMHKKPASESFDIDDDPYGIMMEYAYEEYLGAKQNYRIAVASESCMDEDIATEASVSSVAFSAVLALGAVLDSNSRQAWRMKNSEAKKAIDKSIKEAKAAVKAGETDKAINLYKNAIKGYQGILAAVKKLPKKSNADAGLSKTLVKDNRDSIGKSAAIGYLEDKIASCEDAILKIKNNKEKNVSSDNQASESYVDDALFSLDMAIEGLTSDIEDDEDPLEGLDDALESFETDGGDSYLEPATEAAEIAAAGAVVAMYAALIALCAKVSAGGSSGVESKYIKMLNKEVKPKLKEAKKKIKAGKVKRDYNMAIAGCKEVITIDEKIKKSVEELGREIKVSETRNSDGSSSEKIKKAFGFKASATLDKVAEEIDTMKAQIKIFELKNKKKSGNVDDSATEAFIAGYTRALEAMDMDEENDEEIFGDALESSAGSFLKELL